jgi:hypothetical protein
MSTTVHYSGTRAQKLAASLDDAKWYLGVQGLPATAMIREAYNTLNGAI